MQKKQEALVILPGWTRSVKTYQKLIDSAPNASEIIFIPHEQVIKDGNIELFIERLSRFLEEKKLKKFQLLGHSLGGALALEYVLVHPEKVSHLYLVNNAGIYGKETIGELLGNQIKNLLIRKGKITKAVTNSSGLVKNFKMQILLGKYAHFIDLEDRVKDIKVPVTIFWGQKDVIHPVWQAEKIHQQIKNSKLILLEDEGHDWLAYSPDLFWKNV